MKKKSIILVCILVLISIKLVTCIINRNNLTDNIMGSAHILTTVKEFEQLLIMSIYKESYFFESDKEEFKPSEEREWLQRKTFKINNRDLIKELTVCIDEFVYLYNNKKYDKIKLEEIQRKIVEIKKVTKEWRVNNNNESILLTD
ncbi:MAG: hypothetical protein ACRC7N_12715 [Clostridium sp.]